MAKIANLAPCRQSSFPNSIYLVRNSTKYQMGQVLYHVHTMCSLKVISKVCATSQIDS